MTNNYDVDKLRRIVKKKRDDSSNRITNYKCQTCENGAYIDDHQTHTPNYCSYCECVRTFVKIDRE